MRIPFKIRKKSRAQPLPRARTSKPEEADGQDELREQAHFIVYKEADEPSPVPSF